MTAGYKNAPIQEALVEFRFKPGQEWDPTFAGKLHTHASIESAYTGKPRLQKVMEAQIKAGPEEPPSFAVREGTGRTQLLSDDGSRLLSLGSDVLSVHELAPYSGWDNFRPRIEAALRAYDDVASPHGVTRIGVRYVNSISIPTSAMQLDHYFTCSPPHADGFPETMSGFMNRVEYVEEGGVKFLLTFASIEAPSDSSGFLLDLDFNWQGPAAPLDDVMHIVDDLHRREGLAFEATITDKAREIFNA